MEIEQREYKGKKNELSGILTEDIQLIVTIQKLQEENIHKS